ncbi:MAG: hypothetical protein QOG64_327, partial [Acidimicrobiaceae bacterium]|nr:hypothetical protein [Acidimicrobiaceae bacterium]
MGKRVSDLRRYLRVAVPAALIGIVGFLAAPNAHAVTCNNVWDGSSGDHQYQTPANWSLNHVPTSTEFACVPGTNLEVIQLTGSPSPVLGVQFLGNGFALNGDLSVTDTTQPSTIRNLTHSGGNLTVATGDTMTLKETTLLTGGTLTGGGTFMTVAGSALTFVSSTQIRSGSTLSLGGAASWTGGNVCLGEASKLDNAGTLAMPANGLTIFDCGGATSRVRNLATGAINRTGAAGQGISIQIPFDNLGTVNVGPGDFSPGPNSATGSDTGTYNIGSGANVVLQSFGRKFGSTGVVNGPGTLLVNENVTFAG